jgi:hypothetical protein
VDVETKEYNETVKMKFMRCTEGYNLLDHRKRRRSLEQLRIDPVEKNLALCKQKWLNHVSRMGGIRHPRQLLDYLPVGRRRPVRPLKRPLDGHSRVAQTNHLLA